METTRISGIDTPVSRIGLGTWAIGGWMWGGTDDGASIETIRKALASGINLIDTAPVYGFGHSEEVVGRALEGRRSQAVIATKVALEWPDGKPRRNASAARIRTEIEDSLRRLRTDYIDLYQVHWPDASVPAEETAGELEKLRREGKILSIGVSNYDLGQMAAFRAIAPLSVLAPVPNLGPQTGRTALGAVLFHARALGNASGGRLRGRLEGEGCCGRMAKPGAR